MVLTFENYLSILVFFFFLLDMGAACRILITQPGIEPGPQQWASQTVLVTKNPPANVGDVRDTGSIPGSGMATHSWILSSILAWRIPWTKEPGRLQSMVLQRVGHNWGSLACMHAQPWKRRVLPAWLTEKSYHLSVLTITWKLDD